MTGGISNFSVPNGLYDFSEKSITKMQRELPRWIFIAFLPTSSFSWPTVPPTWPPPHPRPLLHPEIIATHLFYLCSVCRQLGYE